MIKRILEKKVLNKEDLLKLMLIDNQEDLNILLEKAYEIKLKYRSNKVFYRGLIECSNICIKNCKYCGIRNENKKVDRFILSKEDILDSAKIIYDSGYASMAIQAGERNDKKYIDFIEDVVYSIQNMSKLDMGITLSLGEQTYETYKRWFDAGATRYLLRIETTNRDLFTKIHYKDKLHSYEKRIKALKDLKKIGYQVGTGVMIGLPGQTEEDLVNDILFFKEIDIDMIGMGPYILHEDTPMGIEFKDKLLPNKKRLELSLKMIAICRIYLQNINIAATTALQVLDKFGREQGIKAGANIIMPNVTKKDARKNYNLYNGKPGLKDNSNDVKKSLDENLKNIGEEVGYFQKGDSPHYFKRLKKN
ncbi:[FeFe] hydrogenase H-cluster radical SAM maturase HydE [Fusobacterium sp. IOR10]|uniref:[FeFe] hydrogenase H-cluster radical SAM maturase HydE n=1 Tax=Fusobacterium sp. IOR10 TaxID=2665157 RepID=UPI0013D51402|nr:[FeFe] hydrogenase H-cluster radical SAM maturase HydE [Fusobacterium sp. IOR10]